MILHPDIFQPDVFRPTLLSSDLVFDGAGDSDETPENAVTYDSGLITFDDVAATYTDP